MAISSKFNTKSQVKSVSLPCRSHPTTLHIQQHLNTAKTAAAVAASSPSLNTATCGLSRLAELYQSMDDLLNLPTVNRVLISHDKKWVEELIDESLIFLDVCGSLKEIVTQMKSHVRDLLCSLRRRRNRKCEWSKEQSVVSYNCFRRKLKKDVKLLTGRLKQVDYNMIAGGGLGSGSGSGSVVVMESDNYRSDCHQFAAVMKAVIGVSETTVSVFESLLSMLSVGSNCKRKRWSIVVSKLMHKGMVGCEGHQEQGIGNELENVEDLLQALCRKGLLTPDDDDEVKTVRCRLERMESGVECLERGLECLFRRLIGNRACLLNIISM